jgi:tetratricopeptide (TPR) repeat protein
MGDASHGVGAVAGSVDLTGINVAGRDLRIDRQEIHLPPPVVPAPTNLFQLPPDIADFTGRQDVLDEIRAILERPADKRERAVAQVAVVGRAGVGKTAVAIRAAHQLPARFPDGQLYVNLRGFEPQRLDPAAVLADFLRALGVDGAGIPPSLEDRAKLYRERLRDRRVLVVLDNAAGPAQVRDLLPESPSTGVLLTSRAPLAALGGTHSVYLDVLARAQAVDLLARIAGPQRVAADADSAGEIVRLCGYLPLAVRIAGARLAERPKLQLSYLAARLADERRVLTELTAADLDVRASFVLSYQVRSPAERRAFRLLGLLRAPDFTAWRAAALLDCGLEEAEDLVGSLVVAQLLDETGEDVLGQPRFRFHDLLRAFARERAEQEETPQAQRAAVERVGGAFLVLAELAAARLEPGDPPIAHRSTARRWPIEDQDLLGKIAASPLAWFAVERAGLVIAVERAAAVNLGDLAWELTSALQAFFDLRSYWDDWRRTHTVALSAAQEGQNRFGEAVTLRYLGRLQRYSSQWQAAMDSLQSSVDIFRELAEPRHEASSLVDVVRLCWLRSDWKPALAAFGHGVALFRQVGDRHGEARILQSISLVYDAQGRWEDALACVDAALPVFRDYRDRRWTAAALGSRGDLLRQLGRWEEAIASIGEALSLLSSLGNRWWSAVTLRSLGDVYRDLGRWDEARTCLEQGLSVLQELGSHWWAAVLRVSLADVHRAQYRWEDAIGCIRHSEPVFAEAGDRRWQAIAWCSLGAIYRDQHEWTMATECIQRSLTVFRALGDRQWQGKALTTLGAVRACTGDAEAARVAWQEALVHFRELQAWQAEEVAALLA